MEGFVKIHRKIINWEWYEDRNTKALFFHLLLTANYKDKKYKGMNLKAGTVITGLEKLSRETGLSVQQVRTSLNKLLLTNEITNETSTKGSVIQIVNYKKYQALTGELTKEEQTGNKQVTTNNKDNKEKKEKKAGHNVKIDMYGKTISDDN